MEPQPPFRNGKHFMLLWCRLPFVAFAETVLYMIVVHIPGRLTSPMKKETHI